MGKKSKKERKPFAHGGFQSAQEDAVVMRRQGKEKINSDILGSYTGTPEKDEMPEQDADDL